MQCMYRYVDAVRLWLFGSRNRSNIHSRGTECTALVTPAMNEPWRPAEVLQAQLHDLLQQQLNRTADMPVGRGREAFCLLAFNARQDLHCHMEYLGKYVAEGRAHVGTE